MCMFFVFSISMVVGFIVGSHYRTMTQKDIIHQCKKDSLELTFKGTFTYPQLHNKGVVDSSRILFKNPILGYVKTPNKAVMIASAFISQEFGPPCSIGLDKYELFLCDSLWIISGNITINGKREIITVEIDKTSGSIWRMDKYNYEQAP